MTPELTKRSEYIKRLGMLRTERQSYFEHWREISQFMLPRSGRFFLNDHASQGTKKHNNIINNTATRGIGILAAGMMAGMTSPARPWFRLATPDDSLMEHAPVKVWLNQVTKRMLDIFAGSNTYRALHSIYGELGAFGTGATMIVPSFSTVIHHTPLTVGEYMLALDAEGNVNTITREFEFTVLQLVSEFGRDKCSQTVRNLYDAGNFDKWVPVVHFIEPRTTREPGKRDAKNMAFKSCYFEAGGQEDIFLRESGFKRFPALCPRWATTGTNIYGDAPGMDALGDTKQLQHDELRKAQAIDYMTKPPLGMPAALKDQEFSTLPGGVAYYDTTAGGVKIEPMWNTNLDIAKLDQSIARVEGRIMQTFFADLFLMMQQDQRSGVTAREIAERHEEKLLMLGPVLERLHDELLKPKIDIVFDQMVAANLVPPPPPELHGVPLTVRFVSMLAQAQRAVGTQQVDRLIGTIGSVALMQRNAGVPVTSLDKLDTDQAIDVYADLLGVDPSILVADDKVFLIRDERARAQAQAQKATQMQQAAATAKDASQADTSGKNALTDVMGQFSGYSVPGVL